MITFNIIFWSLVFLTFVLFYFDSACGWDGITIFMLVPLIITLTFGLMGEYEYKSNIYDAVAEQVGTEIVVSAEGTPPLIVKEVKYLCGDVKIKETFSTNGFGAKVHDPSYKVILDNKK